MGLSIAISIISSQVDVKRDRTTRYYAREKFRMIPYLAELSFVIYNISEEIKDIFIASPWKIFFAI